MPNRPTTRCYAAEMKEAVRQILRRRGIEVTGYRHTVPYRRQQLLAHQGVDLLLDIGANAGQYATSVRRAGYAHPLPAIQPASAPFAQLSQAAATDPLWEVRRAAVGSTTGTV